MVCLICLIRINDYCTQNLSLAVNVFEHLGLCLLFVGSGRALFDFATHVFGCAAFAGLLHGHLGDKPGPPFRLLLARKIVLEAPQQFRLIADAHFFFEVARLEMRNELGARNGN